MAKKTIKNISKKNKFRKRKQTKKQKYSKRKIGGETFGEIMYKYTLGPKRNEIIPQATSIVQGISKGYGLGGIGGWTDLAWENGGDEYLVTVPLSLIILWHPVRGKGERAEAGEKTTKRANETYKVLMNSLSEQPDESIPTITYSRQKPLTAQQINTIPQMNSNDTIKVCPININYNKNEMGNINEYADKITNLETSEKDILNTKTTDPTKTTRIEAVGNMLQKNISELQDLLYKNEAYAQYFLVLSGQGRLQAIIEAVKNANISPDNFYIRLSCKNIYLDICNVLLKIHNDWVEAGDFDDERHYMYFNGEYHPMTKLDLAFSCSKTRSRKDTLCYAKYKSGKVLKQNLGCSDIYNYSIPFSRYFSQ
jgi:hypothetical protein